MCLKTKGFLKFFPFRTKEDVNFQAEKSQGS